ncbi:MAG: hypothetical protein H3C62_10980 [Gemmatimonadaceae bacterium]|nr:hypothetical protein [Gemmatimonadaceae bacterium]
MSDSNYHPEDQKAAFTGLLVGVVALLIVCVSIVELTNMKFGAHTKPAAEAAK